jgi:hypothetical protein
MSVGARGKTRATAALGGMRKEEGQSGIRRVLGSDLPLSSFLLPLDRRSISGRCEARPVGVADRRTHRAVGANGEAIEGRCRVGIA